jgi:hypothetical protein
MVCSTDAVRCLWHSKARDAMVGSGKALELDRLREQGVVVVGHIVRAEGTKVAFASGESTEVKDEH